MLIGSGMMARGFAGVSDDFPDVFIHAAGVSNSGCRDEFEFRRERTRLQQSLDNAGQAATFLYFSTCGVYDPHTRESDYVRHKLEMESLVARHPRPLIVRLPQVAGQTSNPHTLLNYLYARLSRSERFPVWRNARRNVIDIVDVVAIVRALLPRAAGHRAVVNVANVRSYAIGEIVEAMERVIGKKAIVDIRDEGGSYEIDIAEVGPVIDGLGIRFDDGYLAAVVRKYYGQPTSRRSC